MFKFSLRLSVFTFLSLFFAKLAQLVNVYNKSNVKRDTNNFAKTGQSSFRLTVQWRSKPSRGDDSKNCHELVSFSTLVP